MIQRIQTVYLALVLILSFVGLFSKLAYWTVADATVASFSSFTFQSTGAFEAMNSMSGPWCLGVLLLLVMFLSVMSIMLFRKRMRQLRLTIFSTILLFGYVVSYAVFAYFYQQNLDLIVPDSMEVNSPTFHISFVGLFPVISIILNCLAIAGIRKDEALVRSLDRLR